MELARNRKVATAEECGLLATASLFIYIKLPILSPYHMHMTLLAARPRP